MSRKSNIGRDWPARSPDFNPLDFFLWGYLKSKVYTPLPRDLDELENNIRREVEALDPRVVFRAILEIRSRGFICINKEGGYVE